PTASDGNPVIKLAKDIDDTEASRDIREAKYKDMLEKRKFEDELAQCWFQAGLTTLPLQTAEDDILTAAADVNTATLHAQTLGTKVASEVIEARAAIARENGLVRPRIAFNYWADEKQEIFKRRMERARRLTYLLLRAVEHDLQRSYDRDAQV